MTNRDFITMQLSMLLFVVVTCLLATAQSLSLPTSNRLRPGIRAIFPNGKIVGGTQATIEELPHQVALEDSGYLFCGGAIISKNYVLTAAHCTDGSRPSDITVRYGTSKLESGGSTSKVSSIAQNPGFTQANFDYDVSILKLTNPITLSDTAQPITLRNKEAAAGETAQVSGWGTLHFGDSDLPSNLRKVSIPVVARNTCNNAYDGDISARMICAGVAGKDSCQGDSGGAITVDGVQVGVVSWGYACAEDGYPGVYSNIAAPVLKSYINDNSNNEATWV